MAEIQIHRKHQLGLGKARKVAWRWAEEVEKKFDMECTVIEGETSDTVEFVRSGVKGCLIVAGDHFDLSARLGILLGAFSKVIESEIERNLDDLLAGGNSANSANSANSVRARSSGHGGNNAKDTVRDKPASKKAAGKGGRK